MSVTGGNSIPVLQFGVDSARDLFPILYPHGNYALHNVSVRLVDPDNPNNGSLIVAKDTTLLAHMATPFPTSRLTIPAGVIRKNFNIFVSAQNGYFEEEVMLVRLLGVTGWAVSLIVKKDGKVIYGCQDEEYRKRVQAPNWRHAANEEYDNSLPMPSPQV